MSRMKKLRALTKTVSKSHGTKVIGSATNMHKDLPRLLTGSLSLDFALGGGVPVGRTTIFRGGESSAKTTTAYRIAGIAQNLCANCLRFVEDLEVVEYEDKDTGELYHEAVGFCDCYQAGIFTPKQYADEKKDDYKDRLKKYEENSYEEFRVALFDIEGDMDFEWAGILGIDVRRLLYSRPATAEEAIDVYDEIVRTGSVDLVILDSIALMAPSEEVEKTASDQQQGLQARIMGKFTRKLVATINDAIKDYGRLPTQIWINQERQKIGISFGDNSVMPGGKAQLFFYAIILKMWASKWEKENFNHGMIEEHKQDMATSVRVNFVTDKNKTFTPKVGGMYRMLVSGPNKGHIDELKFVLAQAEKFGFYRTEGDVTKKKWYVGDEEYKTKKEAMDRINEPAVMNDMKRRLLEKMLGAA